MPISPLSTIMAILFDTFGTTVDWLAGMTAFGRRLGGRRGIDADWARLVKEWRAHYKHLARALDAV